jgi:hypothetical protein
MSHPNIAFSSCGVAPYANEDRADEHSVDDQEKALRCYRDVLGFKLKEDVPLGAHRWPMLVSPEGQVGVGKWHDP